MVKYAEDKAEGKDTRSVEIAINMLKNNEPLDSFRNSTATREVRGESEWRKGMYTPVHEDSSTESTKQFSMAVEFRKKSI